MITADTRKRLRKLAKLTAPACEACPQAVGSTTRCCAAVFCEIADEQAKMQGHTQERVSSGPVPFLGPQGCVMPPEYRPGCSGYLCPGQFTKKIRKRHDQLLSACKLDPEFAAMLEHGKERSVVLLEAKVKEHTEMLGRARAALAAKVRRDQG